MKKRNRKDYDVKLIWQSYNRVLNSAKSLQSSYDYLTASASPSDDHVHRELENAHMSISIIRNEITFIQRKAKKHSPQLVLNDKEQTLQLVLEEVAKEMETAQSLKSKIEGHLQGDALPHRPLPPPKNIHAFAIATAILCEGKDANVKPTWAQSPGKVAEILRKQ